MWMHCTSSIAMQQVNNLFLTLYLLRINVVGIPKHYGQQSSLARHQTETKKWGRSKKMRHPFFARSVMKKNASHKANYAPPSTIKELFKKKKQWEAKKKTLKSKARVSSSKSIRARTKSDSSLQAEAESKDLSQPSSALALSSQFLLFEIGSQLMVVQEKSNEVQVQRELVASISPRRPARKANYNQLLPSIDTTSIPQPTPIPVSKAGYQEAARLWDCFDYTSQSQRDSRYRNSCWSDSFLQASFWAIAWELESFKALTESQEIWSTPINPLIQAWSQMLAAYSYWSASSTFNASERLLISRPVLESNKESFLLLILADVLSDPLYPTATSLSGLLSQGR